MSEQPFNLFDGQGLELQHLQLLDQQRQLAALRKLLEGQSQLRQGVRPCPHCGGGLPRAGVTACMHCTRDIYWNGDCASVSQEEADRAAHALAEIQEKQKQKEEAERLRQQEIYEAERQRQRQRQRQREEWDRSPIALKSQSCMTRGSLLVLFGLLCFFSVFSYELSRFFSAILFIAATILSYLGYKQLSYWDANRNPYC